MLFNNIGGETWVFYPSREWSDKLNCRIREERCDSSSRSSFNLASIIIPNTTIRFSELPALSRHLSIWFWNSLRFGYSSSSRSRSSRAVLPISINSCLLSVLFFLSKLSIFPMVSILKQKSCQYLYEALLSKIINSYVFELKKRTEIFYWILWILFHIVNSFSQYEILIQLYLENIWSDFNINKIVKKWSFPRPSGRGFCLTAALRARVMISVYFI